MLWNKKYTFHPDAIIISCFFNPHHSEYRNIAFNKYYSSIKHLNHKIIECIIGEDKPQLPIDNPNIIRVFTQNLLFHKEGLLNILIKDLSSKYKYVFWIDADIIFSNKSWMTDAVKELQKNNIIQLFKYAIHLNKDEDKPSFDINKFKKNCKDLKRRHPNIWRSFASNIKKPELHSLEYNIHGHVGFAWGAKLDILKKIFLYDKALIGGADHIMAHACIGQIPHKCITDVYKDNIDDINNWSNDFYNLMNGKLGYIKGVIYHIWHGDLEKREYYKRIKEFDKINKNIYKKDKNGLYITNDLKVKEYMYNYYSRRETNFNIHYIYDNENIKTECSQEFFSQSQIYEDTTNVPFFS